MIKLNDHWSRKKQDELGSTDNDHYNCNSFPTEIPLLAPYDTMASAQGLFTGKKGELHSGCNACYGHNSPKLRSIFWILPLSFEYPWLSPKHFAKWLRYFVDDYCPRIL